MIVEHRPKKRFGQNFLKDRNVIERILSAAELRPDDRMMEIGPGLGVLTERILPRVKEVHALEVDRDLAQRLVKLGWSNLAVHEGDALRMAWESFLTEPPYKLVANLPYNISSQILFKILEHRQLFGRLVLMFQKEVGDRLCAGPSTRDYGILSVFCQLWYDIRRVVTVPPGAFNPPPKVNSVVLAFDPLSAPRVPVTDENFFRQVVKGAFSQRRKTLRNALIGSGIPAVELDSALAETCIDPVRRGETLSLVEFARLATALQALKEM